MPGEREIELGIRHSVKSHGAKLARTHRHDWLILVLLGAIEILLNIIHPFYRFVGRDMMDDLKYPFNENTVPIWSVPLYAVLLPIAIFFFIYLRRRDVYDLHNALLGISFAVLITGVITDSIKVATGRPRPNFFWRCFPDGKDIYDALGNVFCNGKESDIREGHKSFPSGHTSWSFAGLGFLSLYLAGKIKVFDQRGHVSKLCLVVLPLLFAALVGVSRVDDYWHHWQDVFAGGLIGLSVAILCYLQFFPPPYHNECWGPYAYFRALEESGTNPRGGNTMNGLNMHTMGAQALVQRLAIANTAFVPPNHNHPDYSSFDDLEHGNRRCWRRKYMRLDDSNRSIKKVRIIKLGKNTTSIRRARGAPRFPGFKLVSPIKLLVGIHDAYIDKMIRLTGSKVKIYGETDTLLNRRRGEGTACWY